MQIRIGSRYDSGKCIYVVLQKNELPTVRRIPGIALGGTEDMCWIEFIGADGFSFK